MVDHDSLQNIEKLHELHTKGILSDSEFAAAKEKLLAGTKARPARVSTFDPAAERLDQQDHMAWVMLPLRRYADFTGRSTRREFWMFLLAINVAVAVLFVLGLASIQDGESGALGSLSFLGLVAGALGLIVPYIAVQVRRFHDQGRSGLFALLNLIPYIGPFIVLGFMAIDGTRGPNEFGPDPIDY